ncbi:hypothetical protein KY284_022312 [Solanum tuberosum]|nr:hypothetical protein KY284_022312 [Solanum tuberosum]
MAPNTSVTNADGVNNAITIVQFNPMTQLPIKLTGSHNFSLWKAQVSMLMRGYNLYRHLDGSINPPTHTISQNNQDVANPEFVLWYHQDQLIQNVILASVDATFAPTVAVAISAKAAWDALHTAYVNKSQTRIFSLRDRLAHLTKDSRPVGNNNYSHSRHPGANTPPKNHQQWQAQPCRPQRNNQEQPFDKNLCCQLCNRVGYSARVCRSQSHNHLQARANFDSRFPPQQTPWIVDSGATHHIASDAQILDTVHDYHGTKEITMGNGNQICGVHSIIDNLATRFSLKDLGPLHYFLGVEVLPYPGGLLLCQQRYITGLLQDVNMHKCKGVSTPMASTIAFPESAEDSVVDGSLYRRIIGKLY